MKILILGAGQVGSSAAYHLSREEANEVTVVDRRPDVLRELQDRLDISVELRRQKSSEIIWTADLALPLLEFDRPRITRSIIGPIIKAIGRNVERERFDVR